VVESLATNVCCESSISPVSDLRELLLRLLSKLREGLSIAHVVARSVWVDGGAIGKLFGRDVAAVNSIGILNRASSALSLGCAAHANYGDLQTVTCPRSDNLRLLMLARAMFVQLSPYLALHYPCCV